MIPDRVNFPALSAGNLTRKRIMKPCGGSGHGAGLAPPRGTLSEDWRSGRRLRRLRPAGAVTFLNEPERQGARGGLRGRPQRRLRGTVLSRTGQPGDGHPAVVGFPELPDRAGRGHISQRARPAGIRGRSARLLETMAPRGSCSSNQAAWPPAPLRGTCGIGSSDYSLAPRCGCRRRARSSCAGIRRARAAGSLTGIALNVVIPGRSTTPATITGSPCLPLPAAACRGLPRPAADAGDQPP